MYKNKKYRNNKPVTSTQSFENKTKSVLSPIVENIPSKQRRLERSEPKVVLQTEKDDGAANSDNDDSIPASQPPTQRRYCSQRSILQRTQSKTMNRAPTSYYEMVLMKAGADLDDPKSFILSSDYITYVNRFRNQLKTHRDFPQNVPSFMEGFREAVESQDTLIKLMSGCMVNNPNYDNSLYIQDSLMMMFLMMDFLQTDVIEILTAKILELAKNDKNLYTDPPLLPLIVSQLKLVTMVQGNLLYEKIIKIYDEATPRARRELIGQAEHILNPSHHDDFVDFLINNIASTEELLNAETVQSFTNMFLSIKMQTKLRNKILHYFKNGCDDSLLPAFTKFLLKPGCEDDQILPNLINDLRASLSFHSQGTNEESKKIELDTFANIKQALTRSKKIFDTWQKVIQGVPGNNLRSIDFVVLLMLMSIRDEKCFYLENLIRRRVKLEHFTVNSLKEVRSELPNVFDQHAETFLTTLHTFVKEKTHLIASFAKNCYKIIFGIDDSYQKKILSNLIELACDKSMSESTTLALEMLKELNGLYGKEMQNCGLLLLPLLDRISDFSLKQYRMLMELLCSIAYPPPPLAECQMLQDHIDMLVKKQIISRTPQIRKQGIIGMVQLVNHIIRTEDSNSGEDIYDMNESYNTINEMPEGPAKLGATYIGRIFSSTEYCPSTLAIFYDEMAAICSPSNYCKNRGIQRIDRYFLNWFCDFTTNFFQEYYIVEEAPSGFAIELMYNHCINVPDEDASVDSELVPIAVNLGGCFKQQSESTGSITVLPSVFSLVRTLNFIRYGGNLELINALLGCAIVVPKLPGPLSDFDIFIEYDDVTAKKILNVYFYLISWLREVISAFASQDHQLLRKKVLLRLSTLIELESTIYNLSTKFPSDYIAPVFNFLSDEQRDKIFKKPVGKPKRAAKSKAKEGDKSTQQNTSTEGISMLCQNTSGAAGRVKASKCSFDMCPPRGIEYRQLDPDIILILRETFTTTYPVPSDEEGACIGLLEFRFVMSDIVHKLESVPGVKNMASDQPQQFINYPDDLIKDIVRFIPKIMEHFKKLFGKLKEALESVKGALGNAELFTDELNYIKICFGYCLRLFAALISWSGFDNDTEESCLKDLLKGLNNHSMFASTPQKSVEELATLTFKKFIAVEEVVIDIKSAVHLYQVVTTVKRFIKDSDCRKSIRTLCKNLLCKKWYAYSGTIDKGAQCNLLLNELLIGFLSDSDYKRVKTLVKLVSDEVNLLKKKDDCLQLFPNITKINFPMVFRCMCEAFINIVQESFSECNATNSLQKWEQNCEIQNTLLEIVKSLDVPRNFTILLKYAHAFIKAFLQHGLSAVETGLRRDPERANGLLKSLQITTRFLHSLCCHSKAIRNTAIVAQIPALRETIENLVFRVKAALAANNCSSVFFMGNLKNKDLQGDEIRSQTSSLTATENYDSEDELPDDSAIEESVLNEEPPPPARGDNIRPTRSSRSNCF